MQTLVRGRYTVRQADRAEDVRRAQDLRTLAFGLPAPDRDAFDARCTHLLVEDAGDLVACLRLMTLRGAEIHRSYSAQFYDLIRLERFPGPMVEMGRFCLSPDSHDPDILRAAWAAVTRAVEAEGAQFLFGCSSFRGMDAAPYEHAFRLLANAHQAPEEWRPGRGEGCVLPFAGRFAGQQPDARLALQTMPPLLRTYLAMGGWVSDHAVIDAAMNTLHVFTGLEIGRIPPGRARLLRASAG